MRAYPLHVYNDEGWLKIPAPLWACFFIGLQHLWFFAPTLHKVLPELGELQLDLWLLTGDLMVVSVLLSIGHRMPSGGLNIMRRIWRAGWFLVVLAYVATITGFVYRQWEVITWAGHRLHNWSLLVLAMNALPLSYLLFSRHARDVFAYSPPKPQENPATPAKFSENPDNEPPAKEPAGVAMRKREAQKLFTRYPVTADLPPAEQNARAQLAQDLENAQLWNDLGIFCLEQNRLQQATDFVRQASLINGANPLFLRNLGELCRRSGLLQEAVEAGLAAARLNPQDPEAHYNLGVIYSSANKANIAMQHYQKALQLNPDHSRARQNLSVLQASQNMS